MRKMNKELTFMPHTLEAYECVKERLAAGIKKTCYIAATGVGKFYLALLIMRDNPDKNILFLTSLKSNAEKSQINAKKYFADTSNITFKIYQNLHKYMKQSYDIIILDEFHRVGAKTWNEYALTLFENNPDAIVIGTTATPVRYLEDNRNMAEELFDGDIAKEINLRDAILLDILPYPEYYTCGYKFEQMIYDAEQKLLNRKSKKDDKYLNELLEQMKRKIQKAGGVKDFFDKYLTDYTGHYIVFCNNYEHLQEVKRQLPEWFGNTKLSLYEMYSENDDTDNVIEAFENDNSNKLHLLLCVDMLNEGVHIKNITGVIMMRSTQSMNVYLQQIGRAFSASYKSVPKIYDLVDNAAMLRPMREFWEKTAEEYRRTHQEITGGYNGKNDTDDYRFRIEKKDLEFLDLLDEFYNNLYMSWDDYYKLAKDYYEEHGDLLVPIKYVVDGINLGEWISNQRRAYKKGTFPADKVRLLEAIGMIQNTFEMRWQEKYRLAKKYYEEHRDLLVPINYVVDGINLGIWISAQRTGYKEGTLPDEKIRLLEIIGMIWDIEEYQWQECYKLAKKYYEEHGDLLVPINYVVDKCNLGNWIRTQRQAYKKGTLPADKIELLEAIGIDWNPFETQWQECYKLAKKYYEEHGDLLVPTNYIVDKCNLDNWIRTQRKAYKKGKLSTHKIRTLEDIGMVWDVNEYQWQENYKLAKKYYEEHGNLLIPYCYSLGGYKLGIWIQNHRKAYKEGSLSADKIKRLELIGMDWNPLETRWRETYHFAKKYYEEHRELLVATNYIVDECNLGKWIQTQRKAYKKGTLPADKIELLEAIGMVWDVNEYQWQENYKLAKKYYEEHGDLLVPQKYSVDGCKLGIWMQRQKEFYKKGSLSADRIEKLEAIGMVWKIK